MSDFDDERQRAREAILKRRAKLVAVAVAAGVAAPACGGKSSDGPCLSVYVGGSSSGGSGSGTGGSGSGTGGSGSGTGGIRVCLQPPLAGTSFCLSIAEGGTSVCLVPYGGESSGGVGGAAEGGAGEGGAAGGGGIPPICLSPPFFGGSPATGGDGSNGGADQ